MGVGWEGRRWDAWLGVEVGAYGPPAAQRASCAIGKRLYGDGGVELTGIVEIGYAGLKDALNKAGVPWTPGRGIQ